MEDLGAQRVGAGAAPGHAAAVGGSADVAVVGGGWAGMAAALELAQAGHRVRVFEAAPVLGGRARRLARPNAALPGPLDNGQHLLLGAYHHTLGLMRRAGVDPGQALLRLPLQLVYPDGWRLEAPRWSPPLDLLGMLARARGLRWADRLALARQLLPLRRLGTGKAALAAGPHSRLAEDCGGPQTVADWIRHAPPALRQRLWEPLCMAALNTPLHEADAMVFRRVLRDALFGAPGDSDMLIPRVDLSRLFPEAAAQAVRAAGGEVRTGATVRAIAFHGDRWRVCTASGWQDSAALVLATGPRAAARLLAGEQVISGAASDAALGGVIAMLEAYRYAPIVTVHLHVGTLRLPRPFLALLADGDNPGQFVFDQAALAGSDDAGAGLSRPNVWSVVISAADEAAALPQPVLARLVRAQLAHQLAACIPQAARLGQGDEGVLVIAERLATFRCTPGLPRPDNQIGLPAMALAGDYTAGPYPATIEGAMRSGSAAASRLLPQLAARQAAGLQPDAVMPG